MEGRVGGDKSTRRDKVWGWGMLTVTAVLRSHEGGLWSQTLAWAWTLPHTSFVTLGKFLIKIPCPRLGLPLWSSD